MLAELIGVMESNDQNLVRTNVTNKKMEEYMEILNRLVTSKRTRENFDFMRKEIERMVDLGYTMKTKADLKNVFDPTTMISPFEREKIERDKLADNLNAGVSDLKVKLREAIA